MGVLVRKSFLEYDDRSERYSIHTLLQAFGELVGIKISEMKAVKEESRVRHHFHFIQMMETLNRLFLTGKLSEAVHRFDKYRDSLMFCLRDAVSCNQTYSRAFEAFSHMNIFLDTIFWADPALGKQLYDNFFNALQKKKDINCQFTPVSCFQRHLDIFTGPAATPINCCPRQVKLLKNFHQCRPL